MNTLGNVLSHYFSKSNVPYWFILGLDGLGVAVSYFLSAYLEFGGGWIASNFWKLVWGLLLVLFFFLICFKLFHTYYGVIRYSSFADFKNIAVAVLSASAASAAAAWILELCGVTAVRLPGVSGMMALMMFSTMLMWGMRLVVKTVFDSVRTAHATSRVFIYGIKEGALAIAKSIQNQDPAEYTVIGFVDPEGIFKDKYLMGVKVWKDSDDIVETMKADHVRSILVSPLQVDRFRERDSLVNNIIDAGIKIRLVPPFEEWDSHSHSFPAHLKDVSAEDLLPREKIEVDMASIASQLRGRCVMITGAAGSIGSEIVRQVASFHPSRMVLVDNSETPMHGIRLMMARDFGPDTPDVVESETIVASITEKDLMEKIISSSRPEYLFHAAAYKHVPMMEDNPAVAVRNNIRGTRIIADLAVRYGVRKFVMISTDKAVNPTNVMGCSKRICEIYCQSLNRAIQDGKVQGVTQFVTTRFGNVLGSNGSVIPIFREQILRGGPVTVTHPDIIRFFMLIPEACKLVLEAGTKGHGGEIYVFDMGKPVKIVDLARRMISMSGARNIGIRYTGLRDGEKLYEEVLAEKENTRPTDHPKIMVASVREYDYDDACLKEEKLYGASFTASDVEIVKMMQDVVPEYKPMNERYQE